MSTLISQQALKLLAFSRILWQRNYMKSCACFQQAVKIEGALAKMLKKSQKRNKNSSGWNVSPKQIILDLETTRTRPGSKYRAPSDRVQRRAHDISIVLYNYIREIINSGELSQQIADSMIEITQVKMLPDFSAIHVLWLPFGTEVDEELDTLLQSKENKLRAILTSYRPIANIPPIVFLKDEARTEEIKMNKMFEEADFGLHSELPEPEITDTESKNLIQSNNHRTDKLQEIRERFDVGDTPVVHMESNNTQKIEAEIAKFQNEAKSNYRTDLDYNIFNQYRDDLYGLNHALLMKKIEVSKHKLKHRQPANDHDFKSFVSARFQTMDGSESSSEDGKEKSTKGNILKKWKKRSNKKYSDFFEESDSRYDKDNNESYQDYDVDYEDYNFRNNR
ncbi:uncharacterized protein LOC127701842 [Mytilus californianus]|uniref:uncharacterized protein LOC127701842 n=1 Tax=Mytilus californianus TaxID=6549 RepID=UPI0022483A3B|nr:uncharacterized protein LOC127701842 [Mytilus californianus]